MQTKSVPRAHMHVYMQDCRLVTPLTPTLIISGLARSLPAPVVAPMPTPSVAPMFHAKARNVAASRKNFTALQKNLTASRKCFTVCHYSCLFLGRSALPLRLRRMRLLASPSALVSPLVSPLVRLSSQKQPLIFR